jgi:hypothetical protein
MASVKEIEDFFDNLTNDFFRKQVPNIIAEKATQFFQERFSTKEWDGVPWPEVKTPVTRGTLMVRSGALVNSIKPKTVTSEKVVISAGSDKVPYAKPHNEGGTIEVPVTAKMRKFAWAMHLSQQIEGEDEKDTPWKGLALTKKEKLQIKMPERRFMGPSAKLNEILIEAFKGAFNAL